MQEGMRFVNAFPGEKSAKQRIEPRRAGMLVTNGGVLK